ncbi:outer membrane usher protein [Citrobacter sp. Awk 2]|uniref:outer membrane usher protein n=1 Tax=Citrobacter sp. Awk 2 TaxID=2963959 RepID=UPI00230347C4|nr:outer membrane usher protein [Citrobacter sp. Awk 2]MDA8505057.1 outer membrane usher protein [Citrobacter sp. Awk 2]
MFFRRSLLCTAIYIALSSSVMAEEASSSSTDEVEFNDQFLFNTGTSIDVSRFSKGNPVPPGTYKTQIILNGKPKMLTDFTFNDNGTPRATPCFTAKLLAQIGVKTEGLDLESATCVDFAQQYPQSTWNYDIGTQELSLSIPQIFVLRSPNGYVDPSLWQDGIPVAMFSYDLNSWHTESDGNKSDSLYAGLKYGVNLGAWHFRARGNANWNQDSGGDYTNQDIYLQRDIAALRSQFLVGDSFTRGDAFDSFSLRGLRFYNDDRMLPGGTSTYAPEIRGVAKSNAKVTITQSGNKIYETTVPPGPFAITDLSTTGYGSDLDVAIEEADGSIRTFSVPYSSVTQMLRPGYGRWDIGAGELHDSNLNDKPKLGYATGYYGLNNIFTGYAGVQYMDVGYYAGLLGVATNTPVGAFALDVTHSSTAIDDLDTLTGQSYRVTWSKMIEESRTSFNIAAYRFSTKNYMSLRDAATLSENVKQNSDSSEKEFSNFQRMKNQFQVNVSQPVSFLGSSNGNVYISGSWEDYWNKSSSTSQYSVGYSDSFSWASYSISIQRSYNEYGDKDDSVYLNLSIPLENLLGRNKKPLGFSTVNMSVNSDLKSNNSFATSASGNSDDYRFSYSVNTTSSRGDGSSINQLGGYGTYNGPWGPLSVSASASDDNSRQYSVSYSGGMLVHPGGLTLAPNSIGDTDTLALVHAPGAKGARLINGDGNIDRFGYAIQPYLSAYRENNVGLNIDSMENDVEVKNTSTVVVPRSGAVVQVDFETDEGRSLLLELLRTDNGFIPLGADVQNEKGESIGTVGQAGIAYVRGVNDSGALKVIWGSGIEGRCTVNYQLTDENTNQKIGLTRLLSNQRCQM